MAFEFVNQTVVSLSQFKDIRIYDFTFGLKKNKFENNWSWDCKENSWNSFTWAVLLTETRRFYKQQPIQGVTIICGPAIYSRKLNLFPRTFTLAWGWRSWERGWRKFSSWMNAVLQQHTYFGHFQSGKRDSWEQRCSTVFITDYIFLLGWYVCVYVSRE